MKKFFKSLGPGFITGAADDDPAGIATYAQTGAQFGYSQLWLTVFSLPLINIIQETCGRIGIATGKGLTKLIILNFGTKIALVTSTALVAANIFNIAANLGAMSATLTLIIPINKELALIAFTILIIGLELFVSYEYYVQLLKYLALSLLVYVFVAITMSLDWLAILKATFFPKIHLNNDVILNIVAFFGTTIAPYLFFWQENEEAEQARKHKDTKRNLIRTMRIDTRIGMVFSNLVAFFIIVVTATALHQNGITLISTPEEAANALRPIAGDTSYFLFAIGIIGTGLLAIPVLAASAAYSIAEIFRWRSGLHFKLRQARGFYLAIALSVLVGTFINYMNFPVFTMLYYSAILNGVIAPFLIIMLIIISNKSNMGEYKNNLIQNVATSLIATVMCFCLGYLTWGLLS